MALRKRVALPSGVAMNYHRVVSVQIVTNAADMVEVRSYTSAAKRREEEAQLAAGETVTAYTETRYYQAPYDQEMTVAGAYAWLKSNVEAFADAEDVLEDGQEAADGDA